MATIRPTPRAHSAPIGYLARPAAWRTSIEAWMMSLEGSVIEAFVTWLRDLSPGAAMVAVVAVLGMCGLGLPVPEDVILITVGVLAAMGKFHVGVGIALGMAAVMTGDTLMFLLGSRFGERVFDLPIVQRMVAPETVEIARARVRGNARFVCFVARFLPGLRSPLYLTAGAMGVPFRTFLVQDGAAASISVPVWVVVGWTFGDHLEAALLAARSVQGWLLAALVAGTVGYVVWRRWRAQREDLAT